MLLEKLLDGIVSNSDYQDHASRINNQIQEVESRIERLKETDSGIDDFIPFGISLLTNLKDVFDKVSIETKQQLLSSILAEKLALKGEKYRTPVFKEGFNQTVTWEKTKNGRPHRCNLPFGTRSGT